MTDARMESEHGRAVFLVFAFVGPRGPAILSKILKNSD
jgi:hypothetical protein